MDKKDSHHDDHSLCPRVQAAFEMLGKKWTGLILHELTAGERCFMALERAVPSLSSRMLALRMKELEARGLVDRKVEPGPPLRVTYSLTPKGRGLEPVMNGLASWAQEWN
jgi:DNA-binding HxlR family transcriptional regulator